VKAARRAFPFEKQRLARTRGIYHHDVGYSAKLIGKTSGISP
jgi:hypothetical protein